MNSYHSYTAPANFRSRYNPIVGLNPEFLLKFNKDFLHPLFLQMCVELNIDPVKFDFLSVEDLITEKEFQNINMELAKPYFYEKIFPRIRKSYNGRIVNRIQFTFTYDVELAPINKGHTRYGVINLGSKPIFYYCYVDLQDAIKFLKSLD